MGGWVGGWPAIAVLKKTRVICTSVKKFVSG